MINDSEYVFFDQTFVRIDEMSPEIGSLYYQVSPDSKVHGATWGPPESCRPQMGRKLAPWTLLSGRPSAAILLPFIANVD